MGRVRDRAQSSGQYATCSSACSMPTCPISCRWTSPPSPGYRPAAVGAFPYCEKVFFANSGTEAVEAAIKFARAATGQPGLIQQSRLPWPFLRFGLAGGRRCPARVSDRSTRIASRSLQRLAALERALMARTIAALMVEPIQGVNLPADDYLAQALALCRKHGTLMVADEIQTGMGRTGRPRARGIGVSSPIWC